MNMHTPQSYQAEKEVEDFPDIKENIITAQGSMPIITITQDSLVAAFLMTRKTFKLTRGQFCDITMCGERVDGSSLYNPQRIKTIQRVLKENGKKGDVLNGRGLISLILPDTFLYEKENKTHPDEPVVKIIQGVFIEGTLDKSILGSAHGSIIQLLNKEYGSKVTANFIDNMQFFANAWLQIHGYSIGLEDCMIKSEKSIMEIKDTLAQCYTKAEGIETSTQNPGIKEVRVISALSQARDIGLRIAKNAMKPDNNFLTSTDSGAKGDYFNVAQVTGLLGQQNLESGRVTCNLNHGKRSLPHYPFEKMDKEREYESRGFISHSFIEGLRPEEFFFHAMSGRESVTDTAMGTSRSGYIQRKIVKICEDIQVQYDNTVRDTEGQIYQFAYGENGYDATKTVRVDGKPVVCNVKRLVDKLNLMAMENIEEKDEDNEPDIVVSVIQPRIEKVKPVQPDTADESKNEEELSEPEIEEEDEEKEKKDDEDDTEDKPKDDDAEEEEFMFLDDDDEEDDYDGDDGDDGDMDFDDD